MIESETTKILKSLQAGEPDAMERLLPVVYRELRLIAERHFRQEVPGQTIQPTILVHDVFMRLAGNPDKEWSGKEHFLAVAAKAMRDLLVDHARRRGAQKRGGGWKRLTLSDLQSDNTDRQIDVLELEEALEALAELDERQARIVELRFFAGLSVQEVATVLDISERTVLYDWRMARAWLRRRLDGSHT